MREKKTTTQKTQTQEPELVLKPETGTLKKTNGQKKLTAQNKGAEQERQTHITNVYKNISTEEKIRMYLKICRYIEYGEKLQ